MRQPRGFKRGFNAAAPERGPVPGNPQPVWAHDGAAVVYGQGIGNVRGVAHERKGLDAEPGAPVRIGANGRDGGSVAKGAIQARRSSVDDEFGKAGRYEDEEPEQVEHFTCGYQSVTFTLQIPATL